MKDGTRTALLASVLALGLSTMLLGGLVGGMFRVRHVEVIGAGTETATVAAAAQVEGRNIFVVQSDAIVRRVSVIRAVDVRRALTEFPDRVVIYTRLRPAVLAWRSGHVLYRVSRSGIVMNAVPATSLPVLTGALPHGYVPAGIVAAVGYAARVLPRAPAGEISLFHLRKTGALHIVGKAGWNANLGQGNPRKMVSRVATLVAYLRTVAGGRLPTSIDLRFPTPYARFGP